MSLEQKINYHLNKTPGVKKAVKRLYQLLMYTISPKIKFEGNIDKVSPDDPEHEYFFGYYDKSPWDATGRYMLCMKANNTWSSVSPNEKADIILIDTNNNNKVETIACTLAWNVQQGCMLQWLGPDYSRNVIYNDYREGKYCCVILDVNTRAERIIPSAIYSVAANGSFALTLDFSRLHRLRPGYGYCNVPDNTVNEKLPDKPCIWKVNLVSGEITPVLSYLDFVRFQPRSEMLGKDTVHKVNHIMISPNGMRFMVLHRWLNGQRKYSRLVTCDVDGSNMYLLSDDDMVSHCFWKNDIEIIAFENKINGGPGYYLMKDKSQEYEHCWSDMNADGHPSFSPDGKLIMTDTYPDRARIACIKIMNGTKNENIHVIARVFAPFKYDNDTRCDLHPRWSRDGSKICFDSVFEGHRGLYTIKLSTQISLDSNSKCVENKLQESPLISVIVPVFNVENYLERCVKSILQQTYENIEIILVDDGSTDKSGDLCDSLRKTDCRIKVTHKVNGGLSSARNTGLSLALGDYVAFVDSDDWISVDIYNKCISIAFERNCEVVDFKPIYTKGKIITANSQNSNPIEVENEAILYDYLLRGQTEKCPFSVCRKLYRRSLFDGIGFPEGKINEDIATNFKILERTCKLVHIDDIGYYYFQNDSSITNGVLKMRDFDLIDASNEICELSLSCTDQRIHQLAQVKLARSYFSLLAKVALWGISSEFDNPKIVIKSLLRKLRGKYKILLNSPIPKTKMLIISAMCVNYYCIAFPAAIYKYYKK